MNRLPILDTAREAYAFVWQARIGVIQVGWPFALAFWGLLVLTAFGFGENWMAALTVATLGQLILTAGFSYHWYRAVLLGPAGVSTPDAASRMRYWGRYAAYILIPVAASAVGALLAMAAGGGPEGQGSPGGALLMIVLLAATAYAMIRLVFILPATAVGVETSWETAWRHSTGNALPLFLLMMLQVVPFYMLNLFIDALTLPLFGEGAGRLVNAAFITVSWLAGTAVLVSMIGMAFWTVTGLPQPAGGPPAEAEEPEEME